MIADHIPSVGDSILVSDGFGNWVPGTCDAVAAAPGFMTVDIPSVHLLLTLALDGYTEVWKWVGD